MKVLILVNGELYKPDVLKNRLQGENFNLIIGVDGGTRHANILNIKVDTIIGDLDSLSESELQHFSNAELISYPPEKNETDLELALYYAIKTGATHIILVGAIGGRMDMTFSNLLLLAVNSLNSCQIDVWHGEQTGWIIRPPGASVTGQSGDMISLIPLDDDVSGITTTGLKYPLKNERLPFGLARGISNLIEKPPASIKLSEGILFITHTPGDCQEGVR
ncbi:thiamine diphosphokinase [Chloroflexota bacterium]